jgi:hypothetical protein
MPGRNSPRSAARRIIARIASYRIHTNFARLAAKGRSFSAVCGAPHTAEFERELIRERVKADAKKRGVHTGRKHMLRPHQPAEAVRLHLDEGEGFSKIAALFGCGRTVVYRAIHGDAASSMRQAGESQ